MVNASGLFKRLNIELMRRTPVEAKSTTSRCDLERKTPLEAKEKEATSMVSAHNTPIAIVSSRIGECSVSYITNITNALTRQISAAETRKSLILLGASLLLSSESSKAMKLRADAGVSIYSPPCIVPMLTICTKLLASTKFSYENEGVKQER
jgi:hypothetical protein